MRIILNTMNDIEIDNKFAFRRHLVNPQICNLCLKVRICELANLRMFSRAIYDERAKRARSTQSRSMEEKSRKDER